MRLHSLVVIYGVSPSPEEGGGERVRPEKLLQVSIAAAGESHIPAASRSSVVRCYS